jgi:hypothetical protein
MSSTFIPNPHASPLTETETKEAMNDKFHTQLNDKYKSVIRTYTDPPVPYQRYALFTFIPIKDATPNAQGVYGFAKIRGSYDTEKEATEQAELLIKSVDSANSIFLAPVGKPFPVSIDSKFVKEVTEVELKTEMTKTLSEDMKVKKKDDMQTQKEIFDRAQKMVEDSKQMEEGSYEEDPLEMYCGLHQTRANLIWTYKDYQRRQNEIKEALPRVRDRLAKLDKEHPEFVDLYYDRYMNARKVAGFKYDPEKDATTFMKYLQMDTILDFEQGYTGETLDTYIHGQ